MQENYSIRTRLFLSFWVLLLVALLLPPWYYSRILTREIKDEVQGRAVQQFKLIHWMLNREGDFRSVEDLQRWVVEVGKQVGIRVTYVAEGGKVIADSSVPFDEIPGLDNHADRPEIAEAGEEQVAVVVRFSRTTQGEFIYVAERAPRKGAVPAGVLRLAAPFSNVGEPLDRLRNSFLFFFVLVFAATAVANLLLARRLNRPVRDMMDTIRGIGAGDYKRRLLSAPGQDFYPLTRCINEMAESTDSHVQMVTEQKQQLEAVFDAMQEGVMVLDSRGKIQSINRSFSDRISNDPQIIGRRPLEVIVSLDLQKFCDRVTASPEDNGETRLYNLQIVLGQERTYDVNIVRVPDRQKEIGAVVVFHDISELKRLEKVRQDFVANVSHELRTPLTSIKGYTETLLSEKPPNPDMMSSFLQVILKNTNHMVKMVEDLLQLARLEAPAQPAGSTPVNAASALLTAWKACMHHAEGKGLQLGNTLPEGGIWVSADFDHLVQVFRNLLENAIRYSPAGGVLDVSCEIQGDKVTFKVRDEGPGIARQHQQRIFERFYRVEKHRSDHWGSTGLGLAICRHIVRNHGGRIWVQSPNSGETRGTTFLFTLPRAADGREELKTLTDSAITL